MSELAALSLAVGVALLMIGGEFDLSVGSILGAAGMCVMLLTTHFGWSLWSAIAATVFLCLGIGFLNGYAVVRVTTDGGKVLAYASVVDNATTESSLMVEDGNTVILGGLVSATILNLVVVPALYLRWGKR